jgi:hypothetical protein
VAQISGVRSGHYVNDQHREAVVVQFCAIILGARRRRKMGVQELPPPGEAARRFYGHSCHTPFPNAHRAVACVPARPRHEPRPQVWADLLSLIADRRADLAKVEADQAVAVDFTPPQANQCAGLVLAGRPSPRSG